MKKIFIFIQGVGSIIEIAPSSSIGKHKKSLYTEPVHDNENWRKDWDKVGSYLHHAMNTVANEQR